MQRHVAFAIKEICTCLHIHHSGASFVFLSLFFGRSSDRWFDTAIFYLHRGFFAKAVEDHPDDPLGSKYAPSFLAAYNSACSFVGLVKSLYSQHPRLTERMWFLFTHVFSCTVSLSLHTTFLPHSNFVTDHGSGRSSWDLSQRNVRVWHSRGAPYHILSLLAPYSSQ